jgi:phage shock protein B
MDSHTMVLLIVLLAIGGNLVNKYLKLRTLSASAGLSRSEAAMLDNMRQTAARLEQRVMSLERILDDQVPAWRTTDMGAGR